ncbi:class I SAM-dependent methyltransferase [Nocardia sp. NPDC003482]
MTTPPAPHTHRRMAESFGIDAERYDRARPPYPDAMIERIVAAAPGPRVLDVGCGTGIEARQFRDAGCAVLGVEPDSRMAEFARGTGIEVEVGTFETWDAGGRVFDAIVSGTAWHWVDPVAGALKAAQVLRPGGVLAPFGHVYQLPPALTEALAAAFRRAAPDSPLTLTPDRPMLDAYGALYTRAADAIRETVGFTAPEIWRYDWHRTYTRPELLDMLPTTGGLSTLPPDTVTEILTTLDTTLTDTPLTIPYATWGLTTTRL